MATLIKFLIYSHVVAGAISLISAPVSMAVFKGGNVHRIAGKIFFLEHGLHLCVCDNSGHVSLEAISVNGFSIKFLPGV